MADSDGWYFDLSNTSLDDLSSDESDTDDEFSDNEPYKDDDSEINLDTDANSDGPSCNRPTGIKQDFYKQQMKKIQDDLLCSEPDNMLKHVNACLSFMKDQRINLMTLLWAVSWNPAFPQLVNNPDVCFTRTQLMSSSELPVILEWWHKPPYSHNRGIQMRAAHKAMAAWALSYVHDQIDCKMRLLRPLLCYLTKELSEESLLRINIPTLENDIQVATPTIWTLFLHAAYTPQQSKRNQYESPELI